MGLLGWFGYNQFQQKQKTVEPAQTNETQALTPVVSALLDQKIILLEGLAGNTTIVKGAVSATTKNKKLSEFTIKDLDAKWQDAKENDPFVSQFMVNTVAKALIAFQEENPEFVEIFATDGVGLNIGQTNKTSDYLQSDEEWWTGSYDGGKGRAYHGEIEFDESAQSESIALYVPIFSQKTVVGIIKGVLNITALQKEL